LRITDIFSLEDFKDSIPFTALGARTCYSSGNLNYLLNDPRVVSREERAKFLSKLGNLKHFSVFAHSFAYKDLKTLPEETLNRYLEEELHPLPKETKAKLLAQKIAAQKFKSHYNPEYPTVIGVSLRHFLEDLLEQNEKEYYAAFEKMAEYDVPTDPLGYKDNVWLIGLNKNYDGYAVFYVDNVSRTMTHQLVRHTTLNFSQRSQRYVKEDENQFIIPPSIKEKTEKKDLNQLKSYFQPIVEQLYLEILATDAKPQIKEKIKQKKEQFLEEKRLNTLADLFQYTDFLADTVYEYAVYVEKIKREDARFILPHGRKTTIVVSGTLNWIKDFIQKRTDPHAQWEIRKVAFAMKELLDKNL